MHMYGKAWKALGAITPFGHELSGGVLEFPAFVWKSYAPNSEAPNMTLHVLRVPYATTNKQSAFATFNTHIIVSVYLYMCTSISARVGKHDLSF